jgi:hypothetical protein
MPELVRTYLKKAAAGDFDTRRREDDAARKQQMQAIAARRRLAERLGQALLIGAALLLAFDSRGIRLAGLPLSGIVTAACGISAFLFAWRQSR